MSQEDLDYEIARHLHQTRMEASAGDYPVKPPIKPNLVIDGKPDDKKKTDSKAEK